MTRFKPHRVAPRPVSDDRKIYSTMAWRGVSRVIRRRDPICKICDQRPSTQVDHIRALADGGSPYDPANLRGVCSGCHNRKTREDITSRRGCGVSDDRIRGRVHSVAIDPVPGSGV